MAVSYPAIYGLSSGPSGRATVMNINSFTAHKTVTRRDSQPTASIKPVPTVEDPFLSDLLPILQDHCQRRVEADALDRELTDEWARLFGNYLHHARFEAGFETPAQLARAAGLSEAKVIALERGLVFSNDIKPSTLHSLARVLGEDIEVFELLLNRDKIPAEGLKGMLTRLRNGWLALVSFWQSPRWVLLLLGMIGLALLGAVIFIWRPLFVELAGVPLFSETGHMALFFEMDKVNNYLERGLRFVVTHSEALSMVLVLGLLALWWTIWQRNAPTRLLAGRGRRTSIATIVILFVIMISGALFVLRHLEALSRLSAHLPFAIYDQVNNEGVEIAHSSVRTGTMSLPYVSKFQPQDEPAPTKFCSTNDDYRLKTPPYPLSFMVGADEFLAGTGPLPSPNTGATKEQSSWSTRGVLARLLAILQAIIVGFVFVFIILVAKREGRTRRAFSRVGVTRPKEDAKPP